MSSTVILIPAYQPTDALVSLTENLSSRGHIIVCVDDGSGADFDGIFEKTAEFAEVLRYPVNRGKGGALKHGMRHIMHDEKYSSFKYIVTADADGQHKPDDIEKVVREVQVCGGLVLGVRFFSGKVPLRSRFGNSLTRIVFALLSGKKISDTQTGLRGFEISPFYSEIAGERYEYEMNVLLTAAEEGIQIYEVPIETVYENNNEGSHFRPIHDSIRIYKTIIFRRRREVNK